MSDSVGYVLTATVVVICLSAFFVAVDGWGLVAAALVRGYQGGG